MGKMRIKYLLLVSILIIVVLLSMPLITKGEGVKTVQIGPLQTSYLVYNLNIGDRFSGSLSITGGSGNDIDFSVTDPLGTTVLDLGRVSNGREFNFEAERNGAFRLVFDNSFSLISQKTVTLSYSISPPLIFGFEFPQFVLIVVVIIIVLVAVVLLAYNLGKMKQRKEENK
jgi:hypothetical protein